MALKEHIAGSLRVDISFEGFSEEERKVLKIERSQIIGSAQIMNGLPDKLARYGLQCTSLKVTLKGALRVSFKKIDG